MAYQAASAGSPKGSVCFDRFADHSTLQGEISSVSISRLVAASGVSPVPVRKCTSRQSFRIPALTASGSRLLVPLRKDSESNELPTFSSCPSHGTTHGLRPNVELLRQNDRHVSLSSLLQQGGRMTVPALHVHRPNAHRLRWGRRVRPRMPRLA